MDSNIKYVKTRQTAVEVHHDLTPSFRYLSNKFRYPTRNLYRRIRLAGRYEVEGGAQSAHVYLFQSYFLRPTRDNPAFLDSGQRGH
jgi:hypothetical protein